MTASFAGNTPTVCISTLTKPCIYFQHPAISFPTPSTNQVNKNQSIISLTYKHINVTECNKYMMDDLPFPLHSARPGRRQTQGRMTTPGLAPRRTARPDDRHRTPHCTLHTRDTCKDKLPITQRCFLIRFQSCIYRTASKLLSGGCRRMHFCVML